MIVQSPKETSALAMCQTVLPKESVTKGEGIISIQRRPVLFMLGLRSIWVTNYDQTFLICGGAATDRHVINSKLLFKGIRSEISAVVRFFNSIENVLKGTNHVDDVTARRLTVRAVNSVPC